MVNEALSHAAPGWVMPGKRIYAIGDVHGCARRLASLHRLIAADLRSHPVPKPMLIHLGDYIDRGPDSAAVIRMLAHGPPLSGVATVNLRGNHEQMMLDALAGGSGAIQDWLANNAQSTLRSFGTSAARPASEWRAALEPADWAFLSHLRLYHSLDGYVFVHAGLRPGVKLCAQIEEDLLWIRDDFLQWPASYLPDQPASAVVHGHTPEPRPTITWHRIGIDTGAVKGGALTCAVLEGRTVRFLTA